MTAVRAWVVSDNDAGRGLVVYTATRNQARAIAAAEFDESYLRVHVRRAREWDHRDPTVTARLEAGWWFECRGCFTALTKDDKPLVDGDNVYCDAACRRDADVRDARIDGHNAGRAFAINEALYDAHAGRAGWHREGYTVGLDRYEAT